MRAAQNEVCMLGTYGRIYETPPDGVSLQRDRPPRRINAEVAAWRLDRRPINPATEFNKLKAYVGPCIALTNVE